MEPGFGMREEGVVETCFEEAEEKEGPVAVVVAVVWVFLTLLVPATVVNFGRKPSSTT